MCEFKILPKYQKHFSLPEWKIVLDPWKNAQLLWDINAAMGRGDGSAGGVLMKTRDGQSAEKWSKLFRSSLDHANKILELRRSRFDLNRDGKDDEVLALYMPSQWPCNSWAMTAYREPYLFILTDDGTSLRSDLTQSGGYGIPFYYDYQGPRQNKALYRLVLRGGSDMANTKVSVSKSTTTESLSALPYCKYKFTNVPLTANVD